MDRTLLALWLVAFTMVTGQAASKESDNIVKMSVSDEELQFEENLDASSTVSEESLPKWSYCNKTHGCPWGKTCCMRRDRKWGCCPRCYKCLWGTNYCHKEDDANAKPVEKILASEVLEEETENKDSLDVSSPASEESHRHRVFCNRTHYCPSGNTCCMRYSGRWGCCPRYYKCLHRTNWCHKQDEANAKPVEKMPAFNILEEENQNEEKLDASSTASEESLPKWNFCNRTHYCPWGKTCCMRRDRKWGCCPRFYKCLWGTNYCHKEDDANAKPVEKILTSEVLEEETENKESLDVSSSASEESHRHRVFCNRTHYCPSGNTCCMRYSGRWGCCPRYYKCLHRTNWCHKQDEANAKLVEKMPAINILEEENQNEENIDASSTASEESLPKWNFCNRTHYCPWGKTCCMRRDQKWGCCPRFYKCLWGTNYCHKEDDANAKPVEKILTSEVLEEETENKESLDVSSSASEESHRHRVFCNRTHYCPSGNTCCMRYSGRWGCCPRYYKCLHRTNWCHKQDEANDKLVEKMPAINILEEENQNEENIDASSTASEESLPKWNFCNRTHYCPWGKTCCMRRDQKWGCCPRFYKCLWGTNYCHKQDDANAKPVEKILASEVLEEETENEENLHVSSTASEESYRHRVFCNRTHYCPSGNTCCMRYSGRWGCCPRYYKCLHRTNWCHKQDDAEVIEKLPATELLAAEQHDNVSQTTCEACKGSNSVDSEDYLKNEE